MTTSQNLWTVTGRPVRKANIDSAKAAGKANSSEHTLWREKVDTNNKGANIGLH